MRNSELLSWKKVNKYQYLKKMLLYLLNILKEFTESDVNNIGVFLKNNESSWALFKHK